MHWTSDAWQARVGSWRVCSEAALLHCGRLLQRSFYRLSTLSTSVRGEQQSAGLPCKPRTMRLGKARLAKLLWLHNTAHTACCQKSCPPQMAKFWQPLAVSMCLSSEMVVKCKRLASTADHYICAGLHLGWPVGARFWKLCACACQATCTGRLAILKMSVQSQR